MGNINRKATKFITVLIGILTAGDTLQVDLVNSQINWIGRKVTGEHSGTLNLSEGWIEMEKNTLSGGKLVFDMASITNTDIESPEWKQKLEDHLKSEDFFHTDSFPQAILEIKGLQLVFIENSKNSEQILADLTLRGITHEIKFPFELTQSQNNFTAKGSVDIDRTLYNINYKSGKFFDELGDKLIYDNFTVQFKVQTRGK